MEAAMKVEMPLRPATIVAVSKLLTVDGFMVGSGGGGRDKVPARVLGFDSSSSSKDVASAVASLDQTSYKSSKVDDGFYRHEKPIPTFESDHTSKQTPFWNASNSHGLLQKCTSNQLRQTAENEIKSGSHGFKRQKLQKTECSVSHAADESIALSVKQETGLAKSGIAERSHGSGRRGERRNSRVPGKSRFDSFFPKIGTLSSSSTSGGDSLLGVCGLKSNTSDVTKHIEELELNELLDGSYKHSYLVKDNGKKISNTNESLLLSVRKACSFLQSPKGALSQNAVELDFKLNPRSAVTPGTNITSSCKDSSCKSEATIAAKMPSLLQPKDVLERLRLPLHKDLSTLLLDTSEPVTAGLDPKSPKVPSQGGSLPPFAWSYYFNGSFKSVFDAGKLSTGKNTCYHSKWVKVGSVTNIPGDSHSFSDLDSFSYDGKGSSSPSLHHSFEELKLLQKAKFGSSLGLSSKVFQAEGKDKHSDSHVDKYFDKELSMRRVKGDMHPPSVLTAAQTLCEIASCTAIEDEDWRNTRNHNKPSQRTFRSNKSKSSEVNEDMSIVSKLANSSCDMVKGTERTTPAKKLNHSTIMERGESSYASSAGRSPIKWSVPTSNRSSPSRSEKYLPSDRKQHFTVDPLKLYGTIPSSKRMLNRVGNSEQKLRKTMLIDWGRGRRKND